MIQRKSEVEVSFKLMLNVKGKAIPVTGREGL
jgi:hypothetical protein